MDEDESLRRYGLDPDPADLDHIRQLLDTHRALERSSQGDGDTLLMKLCCVQLFHAGDLVDVLRIWAAKNASFDAMRSIDVQLLCGAGVADTKEFLAADGSDDAVAALDYLVRCEQAGDFDAFSVADRTRWYRQYYEG